MKQSGFQWRDFAPVGRDVAQDLRLYLAGLGLCVLVSFGYLGSLLTAYDDLMRYNTDQMSPFVTVLGNALMGFPILASASLLFVFSYYQMHFGASRSIYLMRRLPDRFSLHRRCLSLPLAMALVSFLLAGVLLLLYYLIYCCVTPAEYLQDGQLRLLWQVWVQGKPPV